MAAPPVGIAIIAGVCHGTRCLETMAEGHSHGEPFPWPRQKRCGCKIDPGVIEIVCLHLHCLRAIYPLPS